MKRLMAIFGVLVWIGTAQAALLVYEGFEYETTDGNVPDGLWLEPDGNSTGLTGGTGLSGEWWASYPTQGDANFNIEDGAPVWGALQTSSNWINRDATADTEELSRPISATLPSGTGNEMWFSLLFKGGATATFNIGASTSKDDFDTTMLNGPGFGFVNDGSGLAAAAWADGTLVAPTKSAYISFANGTVAFLVGKVEFGAGLGGTDLYTLYSVGEDLLLENATVIGTVEVSADESLIDTVSFNTNRGPGFDEIRIGESYADVVAVASEFIFSLEPADTMNIDVDYPAVVATNSIVAGFANSTLGVEIVALNVTGVSNAFTAVTSTPFTMTVPSPATDLLEFEFDASAVKEITGATAGFNANGSVDIVWKNLDDNVLNTNTVSLAGSFSNPVFEFSIDSSLGLTLVAPATAVTNDISVSYIEGRPGHTNVEIVAVNILDASHVGFSASNPGVIQNPEPSNDVITVIFDNTVASLGNKEGATANLEVIYGEVGGSVVSTSTVPVSAYNYDLPAGVVQQVFGSPVDVVLGVGAGATSLNNFGLYTNQWNADANLVQDPSTGSITLTSGGNTRSAFNLIEANTAGSDNFGAVDTQILTNGLYRYDFDYEVEDAGGLDLWSFGAYALINQGEFSTNTNPDKVTIDLATGTAGGVPVNIQPDGNAYYSQHPNGTLGDTNNVARSSGSVFLNIQDEQDALFVMHRSGTCTVRMYDLVLTRVGDYDPNTDTNSANAVIAATFNDISATNSIITGLIDTDTNTNGVENTWRGNNVIWESQTFKTLVNDAATRVAAIVTRSGTSGYDDVGVQDTIALTQGTYDLTMDVDITGSFPSNSSIARVEVYALSQDATGDVNQVTIKHSLITDNNYVIAAGSAGVSLLASMEYTNNVTETLSLTNMTVLDGRDVAIVFYNQDGPDTVVDNLELVRTGDAQLTGYDGWAQQFEGFLDTELESDPDVDGVNNLLEYALNGDPTVADTSILPGSFVAEDAGSDWLYYVHTERTDDGSLTYTVEAGNNLVYTNWNAAGISFVGASEAIDSYKSVTNRTDTDATAEFIRLQVEKD
jgi:hypothetical protein